MLFNAYRAYRLPGPKQIELPATAAALERVGAAGVWVPPDEAIRQLLQLAKQGACACCCCLRS